MKSLSKHELLSLNKPIEIELPDYGPIKIAPEISWKAMSAAIQAHGKSENVLRVMLEASLDSSQSIASRLTDADWVTVAEHFLSSVNATNDFRDLVANGKQVELAFAEAITSSDDWRESQRINEQVSKSLTRIAADHAKVFAQFQDAFKPLVQLNQISRNISKQFELVNPLKDTFSRLEILREISVPRVVIQPPKLDLFLGLGKQLNEIQTIHAQQLATIARFESLIARPILPDFGQLASLQNLSQTIAAAVDRTYATNRYFSAEDYHSPQRLRTILNPELDDDLWIDELETTEEAIVLETLTNQEAVDEVVRARLEQFRADNRIQELPDLKTRVEALEAAQEEDFFNTLGRFALRVARCDHRVFWLEYGFKFLPKPEAIGKALLGNFLEGCSRGRAFVGQEVSVGEGFVDIHVFANGKHYIVELKVVGCGWGIGKADLGLHQLNYYDARFENAELFLIIFDGRKSESGRQLADEYEIADGKIAKVITIPIYSMAPTSVK